jgi:threonylcarbamoyladenosine tRNA methylthiotransferase MtaB
MALEVVTFGCRLNSYESEVIRDNALKAGMNEAIIFNTCAVTAEAERQARQAIRRARKNNPQSKIIVTGCSAQVNPQMYANMAEVDQVMGNTEKLEAAAYLNIGQSEKIRVNDIMSVKETASHLVTSFEGRARGFLQVQNGCDHRCTFCIIPYGRGNSRSVPIGEIVKQARMLVENGYKEIVITGVDVSDYGKDLPGAPSLGQMLRRLLALVPELPRIRLSSIDAVEVDDDLYHLISEEPRLMPHIHISLQAGDDMILKRMKRRHSRQDAIDFCKRVRVLRPDVVFGADIIAGFPTETEAMFMNTLNIVDEAELTYLHVFPYSARTGTPAARMPQVAKEIRKERAMRLREKGSKKEQAYYAAWAGREAVGIIERGNIVRTDHFIPAYVSGELQVGALAKIKMEDMSSGQLRATIL